MDMSIRTINRPDEWMNAYGDWISHISPSDRRECDALTLLSFVSCFSSWLDGLASDSLSVSGWVVVATVSVTNNSLYVTQLILDSWLIFFFDFLVSAARSMTMAIQDVDTMSCIAVKDNSNRKTTLREDDWAAINNLLGTAAIQFFNSQHWTYRAGT